MLFLGAITMMLVVAGGVALATTHCDTINSLACHCEGGLCLGTPGDDSIIGTNADVVEGDKILSYAGEDTIHAEGSGDYVDAGPGPDHIYGDDPLASGGNDTLIGGADNDEIYGDDGNDHIYGGEGDDYIHGGDGYDHCSGGPGVDDIDPDTCEVQVQ
jgi:Ca2+-binding RTX toxin-like protein